MKYEVPEQPDIPDEKKQVVKTEDIVCTTYLCIEDLLWEHASYLVEIQKCKNCADAIVDELVAINAFLPVVNMPEKFNKEKK